MLACEENFIEESFLELGRKSSPNRSQIGPKIDPKEQKQKQANVLKASKTSRSKSKQTYPGQAKSTPKTSEIDPKLNPESSKISEFAESRGPGGRVPVILGVRRRRGTVPGYIGALLSES